MRSTMNQTTNLSKTRGDETIVSCEDCYFRRDCGGLDGQQGLWGCFSKCKSDGICNRADWTCPCRPIQFARRLGEVGGNLHPLTTRFLTSPVNDRPLPLYVLLIQHRSTRRLPFMGPFVAVPTFKVIGTHRGGAYGPATATASALRREFLVSQNARVLLISPSRDQLLERYWAKRRAHKTADALLALRLTAITLPNFSFFSDAPRTHSLWNRKRIMIVAQELTNAGICAIPHLNTLTRADWDFFRDVLNDNPNLKIVAKEFQTGASIEDVDKLSWLQDTLKRPLHPLIIGGARFLREVAFRFESFTLVDSNPFMKTLFRMRLSIDPYDDTQKWTRFPTPTEQSLDELLRYNLRAYEDWVCTVASTERPKHSSQLRLRKMLVANRHRPIPRRKSA